MNTRTAWIAIIVIIVLALAWYLFAPEPAAAPVETTQETATTTPTPIENQYDTLVTFTDSGFSPASITVQTGETVRFLNQSSRGMWVGSDEHPTHTEYDGTS